MWQTARVGPGCVRPVEGWTPRTRSGPPGAYAEGRLENAAWDDREVVRRCRDGSEAAYAELVRRHRQRLLNLAFRLIGDRESAEDVVQETFLAAFRGMERFDPQPALAPWLNTIAVRLAARHSARRVHAPGSLDRRLDADSEGLTAGSVLATVDPTTDPAAAAERAELRRELQDAIDDLPYKQRAAVVLRLVMGLEYAEAAQTMDVPLNTYKSHLLRGTRALREALVDRMERARVPPAAETPSAAAPGLAPHTAPAQFLRANGRPPGMAAAAQVEQDLLDLPEPIAGFGATPPR